MLGTVWLYSVGICRTSGRSSATCLCSAQPSESYDRLAVVVSSTLTAAAHQLPKPPLPSFILNLLLFVREYDCPHVELFAESRPLLAENLCDCFQAKAEVIACNLRFKVQLTTFRVQHIVDLERAFTATM